MSEPDEGHVDENQGGLGSKSSPNSVVSVRVTVEDFATSD